MNKDLAKGQRRNVSLKSHFEKAIISQETSKKSKSWIQYYICNSAFLPGALLHDAFYRDVFKRDFIFGWYLSA